MFMPGWITDLAGVALAVLAFIIVRKQNRASQMVEA